MNTQKQGIIGLMQELLEAERAGVKCLNSMAQQATKQEKYELFIRFRNDEGRFCAGLFRFLRIREVIPTDKIGLFADKVLALSSEIERITLLIRGQTWVVRKIDEILGDEMSEGEKTFFADMRQVHIVNIEECKEYITA